MTSHLATTYLITGANWGIGRGLSKIILSRPNNTLIALVRDPTHPTSESLAAFASSAAAAPNTRLIILPYEATSSTSAASAITTLHEHHSITSLDIVIANAGAMLHRSPVSGLTADSIAAHVAVNCTSAVLLLQATLPLLRATRELRAQEPDGGAVGGTAKSSSNNGWVQEPKFFAVSSAIGSTELIAKHMHAQTPEMD